jgi:lipocalin-like protein
MTDSSMTSGRTLAQALVGTWELIFREDRTDQGEIRIDPALGRDPKGLLMYDATGHFSAQFMSRDRSVEGDGGSGQASTGTNNSRAVDGYDAYFGRYTVEESLGVVTQTLEGALAAENVGMIVTRRMQVAGDELTLRLPTVAADGISVVRTLKWKRVAP